jgi:surface protein
VPNLSISFGSIKYNTSGAIGKNRLLNAPKNYIITDGGQEAPFEFTVKTDNAGVSTSTEFRMPLTTSTNLGFTVNWGDGSPLETITDPTLAIHDYGTAGTYTISVTGALLGWSFNNGGDRLKMLNVAQWAGLNISVNKGFWGCTNLTASAIDAPLITSTGLQIYFGGCSNFNGAIGNWDVSNVTSMSDMFFGASAFNQNIGAWNTGNVTNMNSMLRNTTLFNQNIGSWNTGNVTDMNGMFNSAAAFNQNIGAWDVSKVIDFSNMFFSSGFNNGGLSDINNWTLNTTSNIVMENMFRGCPFNQNIGSWNTQRVTSLRLMFFGNFSFNQNIGSWNTSNVTNMSSMFNGATAFNQDIGGWNVSNVTNFTSFMAGKTAADYSATNLDSIYNGWSSRPVQPNLGINFGTIKYTAAGQAGKDILTGAPNLWSIVDAGI